MFDELISNLTKAAIAKAAHRIECGDELQKVGKFVAGFVGACGRAEQSKKDDEAKRALYIDELNKIRTSIISSFVQNLRKTDSRCGGLSDEVLRNYAERKLPECLDNIRGELRERVRILKVQQDESRRDIKDAKVLSEIWQDDIEKCLKFVDTCVRELSNSQDEIAFLVLKDTARKMGIDDTCSKRLIQIVLQCNIDKEKTITHLSSLMHTNSSEAAGVDEILSTCAKLCAVRYWIRQGFENDSVEDEQWIELYLDKKLHQLLKYVKENDEKMLSNDGLNIEGRVPEDGGEDNMSNVVIVGPHDADAVAKVFVGAVSAIRGHTGMGLKDAKDTLLASVRTSIRLENVKNPNCFAQELKDLGLTAITD